MTGTLPASISSRSRTPCAHFPPTPKPHHWCLGGALVGALAVHCVSRLAEPVDLELQAPRHLTRPAPQPQLPATFPCTHHEPANQSWDALGPPSLSIWAVTHHPCSARQKSRDLNGPEDRGHGLGLGGRISIRQTLGASPRRQIWSREFGRRPQPSSVADLRPK